ncbi:MAG TPA: hypothetical protein VEJ00_07400 [Candidatus Acidoferrales bacterium]|nr:hypothetical protein [Candidatus Acidoferrales bacterium]
MQNAPLAIRPILRENNFPLMNNPGRVRSANAKNLCRVKIVTAALVGVAVSAAPAIASASGEPSPGEHTSADSGLYVKVQLAHPLKLSRLKTGDEVDGSLLRDVYSSDRQLFAAGSRVRLTVDHLEKRPRIPNDHWPGVVRLFTPRRQKYPVFKTASVTQGQTERSLAVSLISVSRVREVHAQAKKARPGQPDEKPGAVETSGGSKGKIVAPTVVLEASIEDSAQASDQSAAGTGWPGASGPQTLPIGTRFKILLLGEVSASKSKPGDVVRARLLEPVMLNSQLAVPAGTLLDGRVVHRTPPRWLSRSGSLYLAFTEITLPQGNRFPITASVAGAELDQRSHTRIDSEGQLHGERPGKAWMAINIGVTAGLAKEADDSVQLVIEAIVSTATDASTAGTARIVSSCVSGLYMATRRGRDVVLPRFTEIDISLDRPLSLGGSSRPIASSSAVGEQ